MPPHLAIKAAERLDPSKAQDLHWRLLEAYFRDNRDITSDPVLLDLWQQAALAPGQFAERLDPELAQRIVDEHNEAIAQGASGVPAARIDGAAGLLMGAQPLDVYRRWLTLAAEAAAPAPR